MIEIVKTGKTRIHELEAGDPGFGRIFSDHMFEMDYKEGSWGSPRIVPFGPMEILPSMISLHYGQVVFEGLKAFYGADGEIRIFRVESHHERFNRSCHRLAIPGMDRAVFEAAIRELVALDRNWVPKIRGQSLYIRPFVFATDSALGVRVSNSYRFMIITSPVAAYFKEGLKPVRLTTSGGYVRAAKGGLGSAKTPANYAASLLPGEEARKRGFSQVLWLDAFEKRHVEEVGSMNVFFVLGEELVTPRLSDSILAGVTRDSVIRLAGEWKIPVFEREVLIDEVMAGARSGLLREAFGTGTAAVVSPVGQIEHGGELVEINRGRTGELSLRLYDEITGIQYGEREDPFKWCTIL